MVLTDHAPPPNLKDLAADLTSSRRRCSSGEATANRPRSSWAGGTPRQPVTPAEYWEVPGADHVGGIDTAPEDYERHVIDFLDRHLLNVEGARP